MKLNDKFITHMSNNKQVLISTDRTVFSGIVRSNETAAYIIDHLKEETTREAVIEKMMADYEAERKDIERNVDKVLETLRSVGALDE